MKKLRLCFYHLRQDYYVKSFTFAQGLRNRGKSMKDLTEMKQWYSFYSPENDVILHQIDTELQKLVNQHKRKLHQLGAEMESEKAQQAFAEFPLPFALVPWRQKASTFLRS